MTDPHTIARSLSPAQRRAVANGLRKTAWPTIQALNRRGLVDIRVCFPDGEGIRLNAVGQSVRAIIEDEGL